MAAGLPGDGQAQPPPGRADRAAGRRRAARRSRPRRRARPRPCAPTGACARSRCSSRRPTTCCALYRWIVLTGEVPRAQDWLRREEWPHPDYVVDVFGSWEKFLQHAEIPSSPLLARVREADDERERWPPASSRPSATRARRGPAPPGGDGKRRREAADAERAEPARAPSASRPSSSAPRHAPPAPRRGWPSAASRPSSPPPDRRRGLRRVARRARGAARGARTVRAHREELLRQVEELREAAAQDAKAIARLSATLGEAAAGPEGDGAAAEPQAPPATVAEAVERAAAQAQHLVFTGAAYEAAADSPYRARPTSSTRSCASTSSRAVRRSRRLRPLAQPGRRRARADVAPERLRARAQP